MFMIKKSHPKESYTCEREYDIKDIDTTFVAKYMKLFAEQPRIWEKKKTDREGERKNTRGYFRVSS